MTGPCGGPDPRLLHGATGWLNVEPPGAPDLAGRVVLVNFWTLTCINWIRTAPYVRAWARAYRDDGLTVVGVHTPEFSFEHDSGRVRRAVTQRGIDFPVAIDNDYAIWNTFRNRYWPALHFLDRTGSLRDRHVGEGRYEQSERVLQRLLGVERDPVSVAGSGVEAAPDWEHLLVPETYLGHARADPAVSPRGVRDRPAYYEPPERLAAGHWALGGEWAIGPEAVVLGAPGGHLAVRFHARDVHLVMYPQARRPVGFEVLLDGRPPGPSHGVDVAPDGRGELHDGRLHHLLRAHGTVLERTVRITFDEPGVAACAFTFG